MIACPNKNSQDWKDLVKEVGENKAYLEWNRRYNDSFKDEGVRIVGISKVKDKIGRSYSKHLTPARFASLKKSVSLTNNRNAKAGISKVYSIANLGNVGQSELIKWQLIEEDRALNTAAKLERAKNKVVDPGQNTTKVLQLEKQLQKTNRQIGTQMTMFQKAEANTDAMLDDMYETLYGIPFSDFYNNRPSLSDSEKSFQRQIAFFTEKFGIPVHFDTTLEASGKVDYKDGQVSITMNPNYMQGDTVTHEFAHVLIDIIGLDNGRIKAALKQLEGSAVETEVKEAYPELSGDMLAREVLATALGREAQAVMPQNQGWWTRFKDWFFNMLGIKTRNSELGQLAREMWTTDKVELSLRVQGIMSQLQKRMDYFKTPEAKSLRSTLNKFSDNLKIKMNRWKRSEKDTYLKSLEGLQNDLNSYLELDNEVGLYNVIEKVHTQYEDTLQRITDMAQPDWKSKKGQSKSETLVIMKDFIASFGPLREVYNYLRKNPDEVNLPEAEYKTMISTLKEILSDEAEIKDDIVKLGKTVLAEKFAALTNIAERTEEIRYERQLKEENLKISKEELDKKIALHINSMQDELKERNYNYYANIMEESVDIEKLWRILDSGQVNSGIIQVVQKVLDRADLAVAGEFMEDRLRLSELMRQYNLLDNNVNQEEKFKDILFMGENSDFLLGDYNPEFYDLYESEMSKVYQARSEYGDESDELKEAQEELQEWLNANTEYKRFTKTQEVTDESGNIVEQKVVEYKRTPKEEWKHDLNISPEKKEILDEIKKLIARQDKHLIYEGGKLIKEFGDAKFYKLPQVNKSTAQRVRENGLLDATKGALGDTLFKRNTDTEFDHEDGNNTKKDIKNVFSKRAYANESDEISKQVPVYYRKKIDKADRSRDLFSNLLANAWTTANFHHKNKEMADLELLTDILEFKKYSKKEGGSFFTSALNSNRTIKETQGVGSKEYKMLNSILEHRLYGLGEIETMLTDDISVNKLANFVNSWSSSVMLGFNYFAAVPNVMMGKTMNLTEAIGGYNFNIKDMVAAEKAYWADSKDFMSDLGKVNPTSKTALLLDYFEVLNPVSSIDTKFIDDGSYRNLMKRDSMFFMSHGVEHYVQSTMMYAVLSNMTHEGKKLIDLIKVNDNNRLVFDKIPPEVLLAARGKIKKVIADSHGQYDDRMKSNFQREWYGKAALMFRKWIVRGTSKRWGGIRFVGKDFADFDNENDFTSRFSLEGQQFEEGTYVSFLRFLRKGFTQYKFDLAKSFNAMTEYEKSNVRKTLTDFGSMIAFYAMYLLMSSMGEDEDDETMRRFLYMSAYWNRRTMGEIGFWLNPGDTLTILKSPAASISQIEKTFKLLEELVPGTGWNEFERKSGRYEKGDLKILKRIDDLIPVKNQIFRYENPEDALSFITK